MLKPYNLFNPLIEKGARPQWHLDKRSSLFSATCDIVGIRPEVGGIW